MDQPDVEKLELFLSCRSLNDLDTFTVSDPYIIMYIQNNQKWFEHGRTEKIDNNLNPNFTKSMTLEYHFEVQQHLRFEVYHYVDERESKLIGRVDSTLSAIVGSKDQLLSLLIYDEQNKKGGIIIIRADQVKDCSDQVTLQLSIIMFYFFFKQKGGSKIIETRFWFWRSTNPFLRFYRLRKDDPNPVLVYETEYVLNNVNPVWQPIVCKAQKLCNGDYQMPIKIELWDYRTSGKHVFIGETEASLEELKNGDNQRQFVNKSNKSNGNKVVGILQVTNFILNKKASFMDFLQGGLQLNLLVAIDFTGSNKNIDDISSLHYQDPRGSPSLYEQAITSVGDILINYDYDKKVPVYGFGCKPKLTVFNTKDTLHCFPLNDNPDDPEVYGLEGIVKVYKDTIHKLVFDGPTYLHPVISHAMLQANDIKDAQQENYLILLILTDGQTNDIQITINDVVASSHLPLSIIIVGIGNADFKLMEILNNNDLSMVDSKGNKSQRDLVQFVPFNKYNGDAKLLSREVLKELPDQVVEYMELTNQAPKPAKVMKFSQQTYNSKKQSQQQIQNQQQKQPRQSQQFQDLPQQTQLVNLMTDDDAQSQKRLSGGMGVNVLSQGMAQTGFLQRIIYEVPNQQNSQFYQANRFNSQN